jgi:flagellar basal-body rod protein FlgC
MINFMTGLDSTSSALQAERIRTAIAAQNIANADMIGRPDGKVYQRQQVVFESVMATATQGDLANQQVKIARIEKDERPARLVPMPNHPDANADGMVAMPNVNIHEEMADMIVSSRAYEANLAVVRNARSMALQTLNLGKR